MADARPYYVLGINAYDHDVAACLLRDGKIVAAIVKERLTRFKHDAGFYGEVVDYVLDAEGISLERVDLVVRNSYVLPVPDLEERLVHHHLPFYLSPDEREEALASPLFLTQADRVHTCSHHLAHAYSAFALSPFDEGAVMVVDGIGSYREDVRERLPDGDDAPPTAREAESYYRFSGTTLEPLEKVWLPPTKGLLHDEFVAMPGLGALYSRVSTYVFGNWNRCGEVMGLAPYGRLKDPPLATLSNGELEIPAWGAERSHPFLGGADGAWLTSPHREEWEDLARRVQEDTERILIERARRLHEQTGSRNLCIAGGVGLNCVANGKILEETPFENVFVPPAAGDDGIALGCACYGHMAIAGRGRPRPLETAYLGRTYDEDVTEDATKMLLRRLGARRRRERDPVEATADLLVGGAILGWFQGGSEFGPRALGHRSILADPRDPEMKDRLNARVKHRQEFRPFAPVVLAEHAAAYFEGEAESPFMLLVKRVRPEARDRIPSIVHVDGTARVQTLRREHEPRLYALIEAFAKRTGVHVLLNTSFNDRGMPIVETPEDAVECFLSTRLDALVLHDWILEKRFVHRALFPIFRFFTRWRAQARTPRTLTMFAEHYLNR